MIQWHRMMEWHIPTGQHLLLEIVTMIPTVITVLKCMEEHGGIETASMPT